MPGVKGAPYEGISSVDGLQRSPEVNASTHAAFLVSWLEPLLLRAKRRQLKETDVWDVPENSGVVHNFSRLKKEWLQEKEGSLYEMRQPRYLTALSNVFKGTLLQGGVCFTCYLLALFVQPYCIGFLGM
jgi:hypothetical protein